ncbi:MAG: fused MFS/spermidine synthase, partial [Sphingomonas bacterium]|nr:fused MFS/spermidine synthase [Sphingomonas bacterium]
PPGGGGGRAPAPRPAAAALLLSPGAGGGGAPAPAAAPGLFGDQARIGVVGLGTGTLACYARPGQQWTIYEIDPAIADIARTQFSFLSRCLPTAPILIGDARLTLEQQPDNGADVLIIDAFSSDSVPLHLLTREAFESYRRHLAPNGLLMVHITNRFLTMEPVIAAAARDGWSARLRRFKPDQRGLAAFQAESIWIALSPSPVTIDRLTQPQPQLWRPLQDRRGFAPWTDDHASILSVLR